MGEEERYYAEWPRRDGEEYLYQMQAEANVETLKQIEFNRIVTQRPHSYKSPKIEYPQFGGEWSVLHHSEFVQELIVAGKLPLGGRRDGGRVTFHDSCYLGRYNQVYDVPRQMLESRPGLELTEMKRSRQLHFCCGGGRACMWMEHEPDQRVNDLRVDEIPGLGPDLAAVACPCCLTMLDESVTGRNAQDSLALKDIAKVVAGTAAEEL